MAIKIQRIANKFIKMIHEIHFKGNVKNTMCINGLITVEQIQQLETVYFMLNIQKTCFPIALSTSF